LSLFISVFFVRAGYAILRIDESGQEYFSYNFGSLFAKRTLLERGTHVRRLISGSTSCIGNLELVAIAFSIGVSLLNLSWAFVGLSLLVFRLSRLFGDGTLPLLSSV
jgi:hypothetical protein